MSTPNGKYISSPAFANEIKDRWLAKEYFGFDEIVDPRIEFLCLKYSVYEDTIFNSVLKGFKLTAFEKELSRLLASGSTLAVKLKTLTGSADADIVPRKMIDQVALSVIFMQRRHGCTIPS